MIEKIEGFRDYLLKIARRRKTIPIEPLTLCYFSEMLSILNTFPSIAENGAFTSCYRELRKVLENIIKDLKHKRLSKSDEEFINKLSEKLKMNSSKLIPLYPSNDFVIAFVSKGSSINLQKLYSEYSHFIHSYFTSWHIFPFSSALEFKIYKHQLQIFADAILGLMNYYFDLFSRKSVSD